MARRELMPWLSAIYTQIQPIDDEYTEYDPAYTMQTLGGDYLIERRNGTGCLAEFKAERKHTGNLFLEEWSDKPIRLGWFITSKANALFYYFCDREKLYIADLYALKHWAYRENRIQKFLEVQQGQYQQHNATYGRLVWVPTLFDEMPEGAIKLYAKCNGKYVYHSLRDDDYWKNDEAYQKWLRKRDSESDEDEIPF